MWKKYIAFVVLAMVLMLGCGKKDEEENSTEPAKVDEDFYRVTMGYGFAQKNGDVLYTQDFFNVYETMLGDSTETIKVFKDGIVNRINILDDKLYYQGNDMEIVEMNIETGSKRVVFDKVELTDIYVCDNGYIYAMARESLLLKISIKDGSYEEICERTLNFAKYGDDIYYIWHKQASDAGQPDEEVLELWRYSETDGKKEKIEIGNRPVALYVYRDRIYYTTMGDFRLFVYDLKTKTEECPYPEGPQIFIFYVLNDRVYYMDEEQIKAGNGSSIKRLDLKNGETELVSADDILNFTVFSDGTIVEFYASEKGYVNAYLEEKNGVWEKTVIE